MTEASRGVWKRLKGNLRKRLVSGAIVLVPLVVTFLVIRWVFFAVAGILHPVVERAALALASHPAIQAVPESYVDACVWLLSVVVLLALLYLVGLLGQFVIGRRLIGAAESLLLGIPLVRSIYSATRQVIQAISLPERMAFKSVVLIEFPRPGFKAIGFLTSRLVDGSGRQFCAVFIPTTPNPTTGFLELIPSEEVVETRLSLEEAFRTIISGGIMCPENLLVPSPVPDGPEAAARLEKNGPSGT